MNRHPSITRRNLLVVAGIAAIGTSRASRAEEGTPLPFPPFPVLPDLPPIEPRPDGPIAVMTSTPIIADLARQVAGERADVRSLLPPNADPHDFEPSPSDLVDVEKADLVLVHGLGLDTWLVDMIDTVGPEGPVVTVTDGIETLAAPDDPSSPDPHVWFDPTRTIQMVRNIEGGLVEADPDGEAGYAARADAYCANLETLDREIAERIALIPEGSRKIVTNHDALAYYADRYGLEVVGTVIPGIDSRSEPSAQEVADLVAAIEGEGVKAIFSENTIDPALAAQLAEDAGITVVPELYTDALGDAGSGADTYIGLMQVDTEAIVEALR